MYTEYQSILSNQEAMIINFKIRFRNDFIFCNLFNYGDRNGASIIIDGSTSVLTLTCDCLGQSPF